MPRSHLEGLVESLARKLDRAVAVDDPHGRLLAYSRHAGDVDEVRKVSILTRQAPRDAWAFALGHAHSVTAPFRVPPHALSGMASRVGCAVRSTGIVFGYLWVLDAGEGLNEGSFASIAAAADAIGSALNQERLESELELGRERELVRDLLSDAPALREHAEAELVERSLFVANTCIAVAVVAHGRGAPVTDSIRLALAGALEVMRRDLTPRHRLHLMRPDHGLLVIATSDPSLAGRGIEGVARHLLAQLAADEVLGAPGCVVGLSGEHTSLRRAGAAYAEALRAVRVAHAVPAFSPVASWPRLGIYRLLSQLPEEQLRPNLVHPAVERLLAAPQDLLRTLECYLDPVVTYAAQRPRWVSTARACTSASTGSKKSRA